MDKLLTVREVSPLLNVHPKTIYKWKDQGKIPFVEVNGEVRFRQQEIEDWIGQGRVKNNQISDFLPKFELSLDGYDKIFLKGRNALSKKSLKRWNYGFGAVYERETKKGKTRYCIDYRNGAGRRVREVVPHAQSRAEAVLALQSKIAESFNLTQNVPALKKIKFSGFKEVYLNDYAKVNKKSWSTDEFRLRLATEFFGETDLIKITPHEVERYRAKLLSLKRSRSTTNRHLALLKKMFNLAMDWSYLKENPVVKIKLFSEHECKKERVLSEEEECRFMERCSDLLKPIVIAALNTGMRRGEILSLKWSHVNLDERYIQVMGTKSGRNRNIPINDRLLQELGSLEKSGDFVFELNDARKVRTLFEKTCSDSGVKVRFHDLRHTFATRLVRRGVDLITVQQLLGHHSVMVTQRYTHSDVEQKRKAVEGLGNLSRICHADREDVHKKPVSSLLLVN